MKMTLENARMCFPNVFVAKAFGDNPVPDYNALFLLAPGHKSIKELEKNMLQVAKDKWGAKGETYYKDLKLKDRLCLHNGDLKETLEGFAGNMYVSARSKVKPSTRDRDRSELKLEDGTSSKLYSGCMVYAYIEIWAQDNKYGKRINATLRGVQFFDDNDAFAGGAAPASEDEMADLSTESEDDPTA